MNHSISKYRRAPSKPKYWIHVLVIFSLFCVASEMDYRELTARYQSQDK